MRSPAESSSTVSRAAGAPHRARPGGTFKALTILGALLLLLAGADRVHAQAVASTFAQLAGLVKPGDALRVVDVSGKEARGRLGTMSADRLTLITAAGPRLLGESDVAQIRQRRRDPLTNGAVVGAVAGTAYFLTGAALLRDRDSRGPIVGAAAAWGVLCAGMGAATGAGIDALLARQQVIYQRPGVGRSVHLGPLVRHGRLGGVVSVTV